MSNPAPPIYDLAIVGGGINGAGIARDAAGRGLSVVLLEQDDLAAHTSSWSTKLIHGGLRYLEYYEFRLVAEALSEREVLLGMAPHLIEPLQFVLPHEPHLRPAWMIRAGLFLYDHLGGHAHAAIVVWGGPHPGQVGCGTAAQVSQGFRLFGCACRRRAPGRCQCDRCARTRRRHPTPYTHDRRAARRRSVARECARCARRAGRTASACAGQRGGALGEAGSRSGHHHARLGDACGT